MSGIEAKAAELAEELGFLEREEKFEWIIDRGKALGDQANFRDDEIVKGCQSKVWLRVSVEEGKVRISGTSDALLVRGIVSLLIDLYDQVPVTEARQFDFLAWMHEAEISLSMQRLQGLEGMLKRIRATAT